MIVAPGPEGYTPSPIMQHFTYDHLSDLLQNVSKPFCDLADKMDRNLPHNPEKYVALRKLLEGKDAAVRAIISKPTDHLVTAQ